jgi:hypothetical protein
MWSSTQCTTLAATPRWRFDVAKAAAGGGSGGGGGAIAGGDNGSGGAGGGAGHCGGGRPASCAAAGAATWKWDGRLETQRRLLRHKRRIDGNRGLRLRVGRMQAYLENHDAKPS